MQRWSCLSSCHRVKLAVALFTLAKEFEKHKLLLVRHADGVSVEMGAGVSTAAPALLKIKTSDGK